MKDSIRLHPKYGVNPTIPVCFWCGKDRNEVALLGAAYRGEAPMHMTIDYEPCDTCRKNWEQGIVLFEARGSEPVNGMPDFTGRFVVVKEDAIPRLLQPESLVQNVLKYRRGIMDVRTFTELFGFLNEAPS